MSGHETVGGGGGEGGQVEGLDMGPWGADGGCGYGARGSGCRVWELY